MVHKDLVQKDSERRAAEQAKRNMQHKLTLYSLYKRNGNRFTRVSDMAYTGKLACRVFSERLAVNPEVYSIRPIKVESLEAR